MSNLTLIPTQLFSMEGDELYFDLLTVIDIHLENVLMGIFIDILGVELGIDYNIV